MTDAPDTEAAYWRAAIARMQADAERDRVRREKDARWFPWQLGFVVAFAIVYLAGSIAAGVILGDRFSHIHVKACVSP